MKKTATALVILAAIIVFLVLENVLELGLIPNRDSNESTSSTIELATATLERRDLITREELSGTLKYEKTINVPASVNGVVTWLPKSGDLLERGAIIFRIYHSVTELEILTSEQQIASAKASIAQAELAYEQLTTPASTATIASADAAVAQAELAYEQLTTPASTATIASADAAVAQAEASVSSAAGQVTTTWNTLRLAKDAYCAIFSSATESACLANGIPLSNTVIIKLEKNLIELPDQRTIINNLLTSSTNYTSAKTAKTSSESNLKSAKAKRVELDKVPTSSDLAQALQSLDSAKAKRAELDDPPTASALAQALQSLDSAKAKRAELDDPPTASALAQALQSLDSAKAKRAELDDPPTASALAQVNAGILNAKASLKTAHAQQSNLKDGPVASILMYGPLPTWRDLSQESSDGLDIHQLETNLVILGFDPKKEITIDQMFDSGTSNAVKRMQKSLGLQPTGEITFGEIIFTPGPVVVESNDNYPQLGDTINNATPVISVTAIAQVADKIEPDGTITQPKTSLQTVSTTINVVDQDLIEIGTPVEIELPDDEIITGKVREIGSIAVINTANQAQEPYLEVTISLDGTTSYHRWTGAPVTVRATKDVAKNVLSAPTTALLSLLGGGYALEIIGEFENYLVPVEVGVYADNWVEVTGSNLKVGMQVVVPK
jgi:multidrug efflux pump subunit AcrA (membrane-fusion protein)